MQVLETARQTARRSLAVSVFAPISRTCLNALIISSSTVHISIRDDYDVDEVLRATMKMMVLDIPMHDAD